MVLIINIIEMNNLIGSVFTIAGSAVLLIFGFTYLLRPEFMNYHRIAVQKDWKELAPEIQILILALMRTIGGGFLSVALAIFILQLEFNRNQYHWIALIILIVGVVLNICVVYATLLVRMKTKGRPPTVIALLLLIMLLIGYFFNVAG
jgi:hypothetical protein